MNFLIGNCEHILAIQLPVHFFPFGKNLSSPPPHTLPPFRPLCPLFPFFSYHCTISKLEGAPKKLAFRPFFADFFNFQLEHFPKSSRRVPKNWRNVARFLAAFRSYCIVANNTKFPTGLKGLLKERI